RQVAPGVSRHSFSIGFRDKEICEAKYQRLMAAHLGSQHHEIEFDWNEISGRLVDMVWHSECPVKESFNTCSLALSAAARDAGVRVVLAGEGADELFAGYPGYRFDQLGSRTSLLDEVETAFEEEIRERLWGNRNLFYETDHYAFRETKLALYAEPLAA